MDKFKYRFEIYETNYNEGSLDSELKKNTISGMEHTVTTKKTEIVHRKLIFNPLPFQQTFAAPTERTNTREANHSAQKPWTWKIVAETHVYLPGKGRPNP